MKVFGYTVLVLSILAACITTSYANTEEDQWLVFRIEKFTNVETSEDKQYSFVEGVTTKGKDFRIKAIWDEYSSCPDYLERWIRDPQPDHGPYILSGTVIASSPINLKITTCTPRGMSFNAPPENEY